MLGFLSVVSIFATNGEASDSPILRNELLNKDKVEEGKKCHADKGYFGKENIKECKNCKLIPNIVPQEKEYSDANLKRYIKREYDNEARKKNRGLVEGFFGGLKQKLTW